MKTSIIVYCLLSISIRSQLVNSDDVDKATDSKEIISHEAIKKLDFNVRQALLRAIDNLEREVLLETDVNSATSIKTDDRKSQEALANPYSEEPLEQSTKSLDNIMPTVQFYTASFDEKSAQEQLLSSFIDRSQMWKKLSPSPSSTLNILQSHQQHQNVSRINPGNVSFVNLNKSNHDSGRHYPRSIDGKSMAVLLSSERANEINDGSAIDAADDIQFEIHSKATSSPPTTTTAVASIISTATTTTTTTTTTPRPTHNEDGENIEIVDSKDIRIQAAPLVTAFTVDVDERGSANKVIALVHAPPAITPTVPSPSSSSHGPTIAKLNVLLGGINHITPQPNFITPSNDNNNNDKTEITITNANANNVNDFLLERQKQLEQQIYQLKIQSQQQQEFILRQLQLLEKQRIQQQQHSLVSDDIVNVSTDLAQSQQNQPQQQQKIDLGFTIRPSQSVEFRTTTVKKTIPSVVQPFSVQQQLPLKEINSENFYNAQSFQTNNANMDSNNNIDNNPIQQVYQNLRQLSQQQLSQNTVQIQPSTQLSYMPTTISSDSHLEQRLIFPAPSEIPRYQQLPLSNIHKFRQQPPTLLPPSPLYTTSYLQEHQHFQHQQLPPQQIPYHTRLFRQETNTSNFGINNSYKTVVPTSVLNEQQQQSILDNQNFYRQHLEPQLSNQLHQNAQDFYAQQQQQKIIKLGKI